MTSLLYILAVAIDSFNSPILAIGLLVAGAGLVFLTSKAHATALVASSLVALFVSNGLKVFFAIPRLDSALVEVTGYRFPSTHSVVAGAFFSSLCFSAFCSVRSPYKKMLVATLSVLCIIVVAWSRVLLHAHLPIDVIVGSILGVGISFVMHCVLLRKCRWIQ